MRRFILLSVLAAHFLCPTISADEPYHESWFQFLEGRWTYEIPKFDMRGEAIWRPVAGGDALLGRFVEQDGTTSLELGGWQSHEESLGVAGWGSRRNYWVHDLTSVTQSKIRGSTQGVLPDGRRYQGTFTGIRIDDDHYEWRFRGKTGNGEKSNGQSIVLPGPRSSAGGRGADPNLRCAPPDTPSWATSAICIREAGLFVLSHSAACGLCTSAGSTNRAGVLSVLARGGRPGALGDQLVGPSARVSFWLRGRTRFDGRRPRPTG